jgi:hypothetical protein
VVATGILARARDTGAAPGKILGVSLTPRASVKLQSHELSA